MCSATCCGWEFSTLDTESPSEGKVDRTPKECFFTCALSQKRLYYLAFLFLVSNAHSSDQTANQNPIFIRSQKISTLSKWPIFGMRPSIILVLYCFKRKFNLWFSIYELSTTFSEYASLASLKWCQKRRWNVHFSLESSGWIQNFL